jgi:hypothetical protein
MTGAPPVRLKDSAARAREGESKKFSSGTSHPPRYSECHGHAFMTELRERARPTTYVSH